jgi:hypothetical protein
MLLLGAALPVALEERQSVKSASGIASGVQMIEESWLLDDGRAEALVSEAIVLLVGAVAGGLLVVGIEAFDLWRERREAKAAWRHTRITTTLQRE